MTSSQSPASLARAVDLVAYNQRMRAVRGDVPHLDTADDVRLRDLFLQEERERKAQKASKPRGTEHEARVVDEKIADELKHLPDRKVFPLKRVNEGEFDIRTGMTAITKIRFQHNAKYGILPKGNRPWLLYPEEAIYEADNARLYVRHANNRRPMSMQDLHRCALNGVHLRMPLYCAYIHLRRQCLTVLRHGVYEHRATPTTSIGADDTPTNKRHRLSNVRRTPEWTTALRMLPDSQGASTMTIRRSAHAVGALTRSAAATASSTMTLNSRHFDDRSSSSGAGVTRQNYRSRGGKSEVNHSCRDRMRHPRLPHGVRHSANSWQEFAEKRDAWLGAIRGFRAQPEESALVFALAGLRTPLTADWPRANGDHFIAYEVHAPSKAFLFSDVPTYRVVVIRNGVDRLPTAGDLGRLAASCSNDGVPINVLIVDDGGTVTMMNMTAP